MLKKICWREKNKKLLWPLVVLLFLIALAAGEYLYFRSRAAAGLFVEKHHLGGKTFREIEEIIGNLAGEMEKGEVRFHLPADKGTLAFSLGETGITLDQRRLTEEVKSLSRPFNYPQKLVILGEGLTLPACLNVDDKKADAVFSQIEGEIFLKPVEAEVRAEKGMLRFRPAQNGQRAVVEHLREKILQKCYYWPSFPLEIYVESEPLFPGTTISGLLAGGIKEKIVSATTFFNPEAINRVFNIVLAAEKVDNYLLTPGSIFSFNQVVGEASAQDGFKEAPIIVNDQIVMGAGGGICQVSSTLYNAALQAGISIVERHNHGLPVAYLPAGLDATVAYDYLDLKFKNDMETNILIHATVTGNRLDVQFFGDPAALQEIKVLRENEHSIPPPVHYRERKDKPAAHREKIQEGKPGVTVEVYRIFYEDGKEVQREFLGKDYYSPVPEIWEIGLLEMPEDPDDAAAGTLAESS